jgi:hypothetical protein
MATIFGQFFRQSPTRVTKKPTPNSTAALSAMAVTAPRPGQPDERQQRDQVADKAGRQCYQCAAGSH